MRLGTGDVPPVADDAAAVSSHRAADDVDEGRLARAVGPDQPQNLTLLPAEAHDGQRLQAPEALLHVAALEDHRPVRHDAPPRPARRPAAVTAPPAAVSNAAYVPG